VYLDRVVQHLAGATDVPVSSALLEGPIAESLQEWAVTTGVDLIVLTSHGLGPFARAWLGSVTDELVRRASMPVLVVRPRRGPLDLADEPIIRQVLIPLDGSDLAEQVVEPAVALGTLAQADFTLLRVIQPLVRGGHPLESPDGVVVDQVLLDHLKEAHEQEQREAGQHLEGVAASLRARGLSVHTCVVAHEQPAVAILEAVKAHRIDLVALATHGRSGFRRLFLGSVADKVLRGATVPILVHRPAKAGGPT
jgi:nucleotide-binding universal stress UspA family protein